MAKKFLITLNLVVDFMGRTSLMNTQPDPTPDAEWLALQKRTPSDSPLWYTAYPLSGGSVLLQAGSFDILREATQADVDGYLGNARVNVAAKVAVHQLYYSEATQ